MVLVSQQVVSVKGYHLFLGKPDKQFRKDKIMAKAIDIKWETDGAAIDLPTEIDIPERFIDKDGVDEDAVSDWLSNASGWLHDGFRILM